MKRLAFWFAVLLLLVLTGVLLPAQAQTPEPPTPTAAPALSAGTPGLPSSSAMLTATTIITTTATPRPTYPAPVLIIPTMWTAFYGQNTGLTFAWLSPVTLQANEWFAIYLQWSFDPAQGQWSPWCLAAWTKDTEFVSTGEMRQQYGGCLREATSGVGRGVQWFVVIQTMGDGGFTGNLSPESNRLIYIWEPYSSPASVGSPGIAPTIGNLVPPVATAVPAPSELASPAVGQMVAPTPNTDDPNVAKMIRGATGGTLAPQAAVWYRFEYANNHQTGQRPWVTITLVNGNGSGVGFAVYAPENINDWWENHPTGRGTVLMVDCQTGQPSEAGECQSPHLLWQGNFGADGTYWIRVVNTNSVPTDYVLAITQAQPEP